MDRKCDNILRIIHVIATLILVEYILHIDVHVFYSVSNVFGTIPCLSEKLTSISSN